MPVILLNGPSCGGKSTLAACLMNKHPDWVSVSIDDFLAMEYGKVIYEEDVFAVAPLMEDTIKTALVQGTTVVVDHVITSQRVFEGLQSSAKGHSLLSVLVSCPKEELLRREHLRGDRTPGSALASLMYLYPKTGYDFVIDTTDDFPQQLADKIETALYNKW